MHKGQVIGNYVLLDELDKGGMGEVWTAKQSDAKQSELIEWTVVIKGLKQDAGPSERTWIQKEIRNLAVCRHPHIVPFIGPLVDGRDLYLVMQYIPGPNLKKRLKQEVPLSNDAKVSILTDLLTALVYLHEEAQIIHRDVKPANILLDAGERAYLADFGIAKFHQPDLTQTMGSHRGSPAYSAPELFHGMATYASDVWSFGAVALEVFTGRFPLQGIPEGRFAGPLTDEIRACLSEYRPSSKELLKAFQRVRHLGFDAASEQEQQLSDAPTMPLTAKQTSDSSLVQQPRPDAVAPEPEPEPLDQADDLGEPIEPVPRAVKQSNFAPSGPPAAEAITSTSSEQKFDWTTASALGITAIGAVLVLLVVLYGFARGAIPVPNWLSPVIAGPTSSDTESPAGPTASSLPTASASTTSSREVESIDVDSALYDPDLLYSENRGLERGPNRYGIGPEGTPLIVLTWMARTAGGNLAAGAEGCRMTISLTGPLGYKPDDVYPTCQQDYSGEFSEGAPMFMLNEPGTYTVLVRDEVSGAQGELEIVVEG